VRDLINIDCNHPGAGKIDRRELLKSVTAVLTGVVVAGSPLAAFAEGPAWAIDMFTFNDVQVATLLAISRGICPHDKLDNLAYAAVVKAMDDESGKDEKTRAMVLEGLEQLDHRFAIFPEGMRYIAMKKIETTPFFNYVRLKTLQTLYSSPAAYRLFGYEGESFSKGGYLNRGFDDLHWVSEVPLEDSGPVPGRAPNPNAPVDPYKPAPRPNPATSNT
jgi:hypothetical protein